VWEYFEEFLYSPASAILFAMLVFGVLMYFIEDGTNKVDKCKTHCMPYQVIVCDEDLNKTICADQVMDRNRNP
jgi:hypothetical protein